MDRDGKPEVITEPRILNGEDGTTQLVLDGSYNVAVDLTGDRDLEIVTPTAVTNLAGTVLANTGVPGTDAAVGDFGSLTVRCRAGDQLFATVRNVGSAEVSWVRSPRLGGLTRWPRGCPALAMVARRAIDQVANAAATSETPIESTASP